MVIPNKPDIPPIPYRTNPSTFDGRVELFLRFVEDLRTYMVDTSDNVDEQNDHSTEAESSNTLSGLDLRLIANKVLVFNDEGDGIGTREQLGDAQSFGISTQAEALAGTNNSTLMTPFLTKLVVEDNEVEEIVLLRTLTANNSAGLDFTPDMFDESQYVDYIFIFRNLVTETTGSGINIGAKDIFLYPYSDSGITTSNDLGNNHLTRKPTGTASMSEVSFGSSSTGISGIVHVFNFHARLGAHWTKDGVYFDPGVSGDTDQFSPDRRQGSLQTPSRDSELTGLRFWVGRNEDTSEIIISGNVSLYGVKGATPSV